MRDTLISSVVGSFVALGAMLAVGLLSGCSGEEPEPQPSRVTIRWNTTDVGSYGYQVASLMVELLNRELPEKVETNYVVTIHPFGATGAAMKAAMEGNGHISYTADVGMTQVYGADGDYSADSWPERSDAEFLLHSFYAYPMETSLAIHADRAAEFQSWSDFDGEPVFFTPAGFMNWLNMKRIFAALDIDFNHVEVATSAVADSLKNGTLSGAAIYTTAGQTLPGYWRTAETGLEGALMIVSPTDEEKATLAAAGLTVMTIDSSHAFSGDVGAATYGAVPILFGYNMMASTPSEFVQAMLEIFEENVESMARWEAGFIPMAEDFVGMQVMGIRANPTIPVHPGMAAYLKAKGAWEDSWTLLP